MIKQKILFLSILAGLTAFFYSCNTAPCEEVDCGTGTCIEIDDSAICSCTSGGGFELDDEGICSVRSADKFVGTWQATEIRTNNVSFVKDTLSYAVIIRDDTVDAARIFLQNLGSLDNRYCSFSDDIEINADVSGRNLTINSATYCPLPDSLFTGYSISTANGTDTISVARNTIQLDFRLMWTKDSDEFDFTSKVTMTK